MSHDQNFKEFLYRFLPRFMRLFLPEQAARFDFSTLTFLDKELIINLPNQMLRISDVVAEVMTLDGEKETIIIHIEVEAGDKRKIPKRMVDYYSLLRILRKRRVFPIAVILTGGVKGFSWEVYSEEMFGEELLRFRYVQIGLRKLSSKEYIAKNDPIAAALASIMQVRKAKSAELKLAAIQQVEASDLTIEEKLFLIAFISRYLPAGRVFSPKEWVMKQLAVVEETYIDRALRTGKEEGRTDAKREILQRLLTKKFGTFPNDLNTRIQMIYDEKLLDNLIDEVLLAPSLAGVNIPALETLEATQKK